MKLFLDDYRIPSDCLKYMHDRIGMLNAVYKDPYWHIVRNYPEFVTAINKSKGNITLVSFDHDLAVGHYHKNMQNGVINYLSDDFTNDFNKTGYHAAKYLLDSYFELNLTLPTIFVHSSNPAGTDNITTLFNQHMSTNILQHR